MTDLERAKKILQQTDSTCVLCGGEMVHQSNRRGVAPLLELVDNETDVQGFCAADRVVGKATAFLYCRLGVRAVHARVMSRPAAQVLQEAGIDATWDILVDGIQNRQKNGPCPMEHATADCQTPEQALEAIRLTLKQLSQRKA